MIIRSAAPDDNVFLEAMLIEAFLWNPTVDRAASSSLRGHPEFAKWLAGWGRHGDRCLIALDGTTQVGAAWFRLWTPEVHSYGFIDDRTPELGIAVAVDHRRSGVGRALLTELIAIARADGYSALSLSVDPRNPARGLYESMGFQKVGESGTSWTLRIALG